MMTTQEKNKALFREAIEEVFNKHNLNVADKYYPENYIQHNPAAGQGREDFKNFFAGMFLAMPDWKAEIQHLLAEEDKVIAIIIWTGTNSGSFRGAAPTNNKITLKTADMFRIENNQLVEHWDVVSNLDMFIQLGLAKMTIPNVSDEI